jgi:LPS-assembly lipoprotein
MKRFIASCMTSRRVIICLLAVSMVTGLSGCGFHLRGSHALPAEMSVTYIQSGDPFGSLVDDFADALRTQGVQVTEDRAAATAVLRIIENNVGRKVLSVNTRGKVLEYEVRQVLRFSVATVDNLPVVDAQEVTMSRPYLYRSSDILGGERERKAVSSTLQKNVVNMAMSRIAAAAR